MSKLLTALALALCALSAHATPTCSAAGFTVSKQTTTRDEFKRTLISADVRNDNDVECSALVHLYMKDKAGHELRVNDLLVGGSAPLGRALMVGESRRVALQVRADLVPLSKGFELRVVEASAAK